MERIKILLDLLDRWDDMSDALRIAPEEFCKEQPELFEDFRRVLQQRGVLTAMLNGENSPALNPDSMIERLQTGRFPVVKFHDKGGLGWVYIARDRELGRTVALKCLQPDPATDPVACQRFVREAEITARLEHPGIVPIYGLGSYGVGDSAKSESPSYAMRFVQGDTLRDTIRELHKNTEKVDWRSLEGTRILRSFVTVCETIAFAHSRHVIHRDLKSANIMLGAYGESLVLDWGLAKVQSEASDTPITQEPPLDMALDFNATQTGATLGTVGFMSPEQARGDWDKVNASSDIFALGAILYEIVTNHSPYSGSDALTAAKSCSFPPPQSVKPKLPKPLAAICSKAMRSAPLDRYASALDLKMDIERYLADEPVSSRQESFVEKSQRILRKHRGIAQMAGLMAIATIIMLSSFLTIVSKKNSELVSAKSREETAKEDAIRQRDRVHSELRKSVRENYTANMAQVFQALNDRQPSRLVETLSKAAPRLGTSVDPRGVEWWMAWNKAYAYTRPIPLDGKVVIGIRLMDGGSKAFLWTADDTLYVIDTATGKEFFKLAMKGTWLSTPSIRKISSLLPFERPSEIPCSVDASTLVIPMGSELQIYKLEDEYYRHTKTLIVDVEGSLSWEAILVSDNGATIVGVELGSTIHLWNGDDYQYRTFKDDAEHPTWERRLSADGRYLAFINNQLPTVIDLETKKRFSLPAESKETFDRVAFGQLNTLLAWNDNHIVTFAISTSNRLIELWQTQLSNLGGWDYAVPLNGEISEWISLEPVARELDVAVIQSRLEKGEISGLIRATTLAVTLGPKYSPPRFHLLYRERSPGMDGTDVFDTKSGTPVRKSELKLPSLGSTVDISNDGRTALIRNERNEYATLGWDGWALERIDRKGDLAPIKAMAWTEDHELRSVSGYGVGFAFDFKGHEPPNFTRWSHELRRPWPPYSEGSVIESKTLPKGKCLGLSNDLRVLALNRDGELIVQILDPSAKEYHCEITSTLQPYFEDADFMGLRPWNQNVNSSSTLSNNQLDLGTILKQSSPTVQKPLSLPWVLCLDKHSVKYPPSDLIEQIRIAIVNYETGAIVKEINLPDFASRLIAISPSGRFFAVTAQDLKSPSYAQKIFTWLVADDQSISNGPVFDLPERSCAMSFGPLGTQIAIGTQNGYVIVFDLVSHNILMRTKAYEGQVTALTFTPDGKRLVTAGDDKTVRFFSTDGWQEVMKFNCPNRPLGLAFDCTGRKLAISYDSGHIGILVAATQQDVLNLAQLWLNQESTASLGEDVLIRELWAEFVTSHGRPEDEIEAGLRTLESLRGKVRELSFDELRQRFLTGMPPSVEVFGTRK